jgi:hypothetical protein
MYTLEVIENGERIEICHHDDYTSAQFDAIMFASGAVGISATVRNGSVSGRLLFSVTHRQAKKLRAVQLSTLTPLKLWS